MPKSQLSISDTQRSKERDSIARRKPPTVESHARTHDYPFLTLGPVEGVLRVAVLELNQDDLVVPEIRRVVRLGRCLRSFLVHVALLVCVIGALQITHKSDVLYVLLRSVQQLTAAASLTAVSEDRRVDG